MSHQFPDANKAIKITLAYAAFTQVVLIKLFHRIAAV